MKKTLALLLLLPLITSSLSAQKNEIKPGIVDKKFSDFTLVTHDGKQFSMHDLLGKNVLLIVPRGKYKDDAWCTICNYQYADFADIELTQHIREKYNLEIVFLFPYGKELYDEWVSIFPDEMKKVEQWKNPGDTSNLTSQQKGWMMFAREYFPKSFDFSEKEVPLPLPILIDTDQEVSKGLDLSRTEWDGSKTLQNIPAVYIIDKDGILRFKYISQSTIDRPSPDYILNFIEKML